MSWLPFAHNFNAGGIVPWGVSVTNGDTTVIVPGSEGFDNLYYDWVLNTRWPNTLYADGTGKVIRHAPIQDPSLLTANIFSAENIGGTTWPNYFSYLVKPEPATGAESRYRAALRFKAVRGDGALNTVTSYGICFAQQRSGVGSGGVSRKGWVSDWRLTWNSTSPTINSRYNIADVTTTGYPPTVILGEYYWITGELVRTGGTCKLTTKLYRDTGVPTNGFNPNDFDSATPLASCTQVSTSDADAQVAGWCGVYCAGRFYTPQTIGGYTAPDGDWEITDFYTFVELTDVVGPALIGGSLDMDGTTLRARFAESSLPLKTAGDVAITGLTFQKRELLTGGAWTTITTGALSVDAQDGSQIKAVATTEIPPGWDLRAVYSGGNLLDATNNAAANGEAPLANYSRVDPANAITWPQDLLISTDSWLRVSALPTYTGYEAQSVRNIKLPYGCGTAGLKIYFEGFSDRAENILTLVVRIMAAGVRAVTPDGTVTTHTLTFNSTGTGTTDIAFDEMDYATIAQAFPPGTDLYITTWYKEASGGRTPYQWNEFIGQAYSGSHSYCNAHEYGLIGTLTSKILLGGTSGGPAHSALLPTGGLPDNRAKTYGPAFILGKPHAKFDGTPKPLFCFGNSMSIDSVIKPIAAYACGDHKNPYALEAFCTSGVGGSVALSFLTSVSNNDPTALLIGTTSSNTKLARVVEIYGHNEVRTVQTGVTHPSAHIDYLWGMRVSCAAVFQNLGVTYLTTTITPIQVQWLSWPSELREMVPKVIAVHNSEIRARWSTIPGVDGVVDFASVDGAPRSALRGLESEADPMGGYSDWYLPTNQTAGDGIHGTALNTASRATMMMAKFRELDLEAQVAEGGGGGATGTGIEGEDDMAMAYREIPYTPSDTALVTDVLAVRRQGGFFTLADATLVVEDLDGGQMTVEMTAGRVKRLYVKKILDTGSDAVTVYLRDERNNI